jgi:hypothetical protein
MVRFSVDTVKALSDDLNDGNMANCMAALGRLMTLAQDIQVDIKVSLFILDRNKVLIA